MPQEETIERRYSLSQKLRWLILGRLAAALLLFGARFLWVKGGSQPDWKQMLPPLLIVFGLTALYILAHRFSRALLFQARFQFVVDVFLVTWLVWTTDVIHSPYIALYIVIIAASSLFLGPRDAVVTSVGCAVAFTASAIAVLTGSAPQTHELLEGSRSQTFQSIGLFDVAFLIVGLLSARLAERQSRSDVRLIEA